MLDADAQAKGLVLPAAAPLSVLAGELRQKLAALRRELTAEDLERLLAIAADPARDADSLRDALSTRLMEAFRTSASRGCFGLLYELNSTHLLAQVASCLRR